MVPGDALRDDQRRGLAALFGDAVRFDEPLAPRTSMRVGGPAAALVNICDVGSLIALLDFCQSQGVVWTILGLGSNVLVHDEGFAGIVIRLGGSFTAIAITGTIMHAGGAAPIAAVCRQAAQYGLRGAEPLVGVPGTVGGAIRMNAGTNVEIGDLVRRVEVVSAGKDVRAVTLPEFSYRSSTLARDAVVCAADLELQRGDPVEVRRELRRRIQERNASQPLELPNSGSIFRNPAGDHAARLIESAGCKGWHCGGAEVSPKHANFIVNRGGATCADVLELIERVRAAVKRDSGIELETEVHVL
ncbi:MAG: UDP-N-acetylenolpyruvoylglucosamine reductase [Candidatus Eremiobacter antarcticus]|nr:MAG: UDP-N-acetylenolpyruvoylglucosamine reductase [Candidatus Eremiobacter sp. RRmetagenome_bin22]